MKNENKDKLILVLIIAIAALLTNNFFKDKDGDLFKNDNKSMLVENFEKDTPSSSKDNNNQPNESPDTEKKVHISGEIKNSGVYTIKDGDRLDDLIKKAGGLTELADDKNLNLAMKLIDQMKIYIPSINDEIKTDDDKLNSNNLISSPYDEQNDTKININTATKEELMSLPNIGDKRADAIIEYRDSQKFKQIEDIKNVTGIGDKFYQAMKDLITVGDL